MISTIAMVAVGGACGAVARYAVNIGAVQVLGHGFPWGTLIVNVLGSFLMGVVVSKFAMADHIPQEFKTLCVTGFLGAFTTFSTFSLDFITLWERGDMVHAFGYMVGSVLLSVGALFTAFLVMRGLS